MTTLVSHSSLSVVPVVILQPLEQAYQYCYEELKMSEFVLFRNVVLTISSINAESSIYPDIPQMLAVGTVFDGKDEVTDDFVQRARVKNPKLRVVSFWSLVPVTVGVGLYDAIIERGREGRFCDLLLEEMRRFRTGV